MTDTNRLVSPEEEETQESQSIEMTLRPQCLGDFVGQKNIKQQLHISIEAAKKREEPIEHALLYGNPGLGKTTLAHIISNEMDSNIKITSGPSLEKVGDLAAILSNLEDGDVLFIDEIHRLNKTIEEVLYSAMEDFALDIIIGKGPSARTLRMPLSKFTLIGATTKMNLLSGPLRDRFGHLFHLNFYNPQDMELIVERSAKLLEVELEKEGKILIAQRARKTPRIANRLLKRVRDYSQVKGNGIITQKSAHGALELLNVDKHGLDEVDRKLLHTIINQFQGGPVGLGTLAATTSEETETIETIYEPYLLQIGMIERTPRGRRATLQAYEHLDIKKPKEKNQKTLF
jgi:holliday junction DNA helicase RuvB